jgi:hypothetical protein
MEVEDLSGHLGQYVGDAADGFENSSQQQRLLAYPDGLVGRVSPSFRNSMRETLVVGAARQ